MSGCAACFPQRERSHGGLTSGGGAVSVRETDVPCAVTQDTGK